MHNSMYKDPAFSVSVGIAALILEGRPNYNVSNDIIQNYGEKADNALVNEIGCMRTKDTATQRISQKLQQICNYPSTSKDYVENTAEISVGSPNGSDEYSEKIFVNRKFRNNEQSFFQRTAGKSSARSLYKSLESSWAESNAVYNGLDEISKINNISPFQITPFSKNHGKTGNSTAQAPHCEQFLKKIGLLACDDINHKCEYLNQNCRVWQSYLSKITTVLSKHEIICIEVYLGPENQTILLEQWTVRVVEKSSRPTMSLQSLCSAIRSQLYFSQIVAWTEQLNNLKTPLSNDIMNNPRILKNEHASLDILFRIRSYDDDDEYFCEKPLVHQFPDANLTEKTNIQVCLKSLPRLNNIPSVTNFGNMNDHSLNESDMKQVCREKGKHRCRDQNESLSIDENKIIHNFPLPSSEHRKKQLQKYRKRILKREKSRKKNESSCKSDESSDNMLSSYVSQEKNLTNSTTTNDISTSTAIGIMENKTTQTIKPNANSVATQTDYCDFIMDDIKLFVKLGKKNQPTCFHCDNKQIHQDDVIAKPQEKAEILLQALERTASVNSKRQNQSKYANVQDIMKRQKCGPKIYNKQDSQSSQISFLKYEELTENNNRLALTNEAVNKTLSNFNVFAEKNCYTCVNYDKDIMNNQCSSETTVLEKTIDHSEGGNCMAKASENNISDNIAPSIDMMPNSSSKTSVHKSSSAPTFYNTSSLSPRFSRLSAIYARRSRHLSDRSSTSEEQFSDDELNIFVKSKDCSFKFSRTKDILMKRVALLGSLEDSLLQNRIPAKHQVVGFKVLLGASGSFCPTQLNVPAISSFYEIDNLAVLTPYVSELKLPRKGYCVPRQGTIQVTLLNPLGTVVRMFVVPYDFSEMPPANVSFIRQRILARSSNDLYAQTNDLESLSKSEQMRLLRYAIHLRFKTSRSGRLYLHSNLKILVLRRPDCDTAAAHANNSILESPNELNILTIVPDPKYSQRFDK